MHEMDFYFVLISAYHKLFIAVADNDTMYVVVELTHHG